MAGKTSFAVETEWLTLKLPTDLMRRIDGQVDQIRAASPHQPTSRAAVVRHLLNEALCAVESGQQEGEQ